MIDTGDDDFKAATENVHTVKDARGLYSGGGKIAAGGFEIPVGFLSEGEVEEHQAIKWKVYDNPIKQKLFAKIGIQQKQRDS